MRDDVVDVERVHEHLRARLELFLTALGFLRVGQDVDIEAGELRGKPHVLAAAADRQAQLVIRHHDFDALRVFVDDDLRNFGRGEGVDHEGRRVLAPGNDVDLLALQLLHHRLDAAAAHADAGADRVDAAVIRHDRDLGAAAGVARDRADFDDVVVDFRHFLREQLRHEFRMGAAEENLRAALFFAHVEDDGADAVAGAEGLARQQLVAAQHRFAAAEIDSDIAKLDALHQTVDDLGLAVLELVELALALGLAHLLHDHLLRRLRGDAAEIDRRQFVDQEIADLGIGLAARGGFDRDLRVFVFDIVDHLLHADQLDLASLAVDLGTDVVLVAVFRAAGLLNGLLHGGEHVVAVDTLLAGDRVGDLQKLHAGNGDGFHNDLGWNPRWYQVSSASSAA